MSNDDWRAVYLADRLAALGAAGYPGLSYDEARAAGKAGTENPR